MFNREKAVEYALKWAYTYNPKFYNFTLLGGDCTNFISQCMFYGGFKMNYNAYGWYYNSLNDRAPAWTGVNVFWNFATKNTGAGVKVRECNVDELEIADIIQLFNGDRYYHNLIVTSLDGEIKVSGHDRNVKNMPLRYFNYSNFRCGKIILD